MFVVTARNIWISRGNRWRSHKKLVAFSDRSGGPCSAWRRTYSQVLVQRLFHTLYSNSGVVDVQRVRGMTFSSVSWCLVGDLRPFFSYLIMSCYRHDMLQFCKGCFNRLSAYSCVPLFPLAIALCSCSCQGTCIARCMCSLRPAAN